MKKGIVTEYQNICFLCGRQSDGQHHLVFGTSERKLAEEDGLKVPVCNRCHNMGAVQEKIHGNPVAEKLSKMVGQLAWEKAWITRDAIHHDAYNSDIGKPDEDTEMEAHIARKCFRKRYGKSYL